MVIVGAARPGSRSAMSSRGGRRARRAGEGPGRADLAGRWDSFCLVTPNWIVQLPGHPYDGDDPDGFMAARRVRGVPRSLRGRLRCAGARGPRGRRRSSAAPTAASSLETSAGLIAARTVVLATGAYQCPHRPAGVATLPPDLPQIDAEDYRNPASCPPGRGPVVGSGQSGCQIAEELHEAGRDVFLACGRAPWSAAPLRRPRPRLVGCRDRLPRRAAALASGSRAAAGRERPVDRARRRPRPALPDAARRRASPCSATSWREGRRARFAADLGESVACGDERNAQLMSCIQTLAPHGTAAPRPRPPPFNGDAPEELDLAGFGAVIFAGGFRPDYASWVHFPGAFDELGFPIHERGSQHGRAGPPLRRRALPAQAQVALLHGVGEDAAHRRPQDRAPV